MISTEVRRLNTLIEVTSARSYLEVGVGAGRTLLHVNAPLRVGVDPRLQLPVAAPAGGDLRLYGVTSDQFWSQHCPAEEEFDVIYLDGHHTFAQTFRDFCASLAHAHRKTLWLLDDTCPLSFLAAQPNLRLTRWGRRVTGSEETAWMGDVYKVVLAIHDLFPQFRYATFPAHGQTLVWREGRRAFAPRWSSLGAIARLGYLDFLRCKGSLLNVMEEERIFQDVRRWWRQLP